MNDTKDFCTIANKQISRELEVIEEVGRANTAAIAILERDVDEYTETEEIVNNEIIIAEEGASFSLVKFKRVGKVCELFFNVNTEDDWPFGVGGASKKVGTLNFDLIPRSFMMFSVNGVLGSASINTAGEIYVRNQSGITQPATQSFSLSGVYLADD